MDNERTTAEEQFDSTYWIRRAESHALKIIEEAGKNLAALQTQPPPYHIHLSDDAAKAFWEIHTKREQEQSALIDELAATVNAYKELCNIYIPDDKKDEANGELLKLVFGEKQEMYEAMVNRKAALAKVKK